MGNISRFTADQGEIDTVHFFDDFRFYTTVHNGWTSLAADTTPTLTVGDAVNGVLALFTDTTDNNEVAIRSTAELFKFGVNREIYARFKIQYAEGDTNKANVMVGFMSALAANSITDNGGAIRASGSIAAIYKLDGGTVWRCHTANNSVATDTITAKTAGGSAAQILEIFGKEQDTANMTFTFKLDGDYLKDTNNNVIRHTVAIASATEMHIGVYCKTGGGAGGETVNVDHIYGSQKRV